MTQDIFSLQDSLLAKSKYCRAMNLLPGVAYSESCNIASSGNIAATSWELAYYESCNIAASGNIAAITRAEFEIM